MLARIFWAMSIDPLVLARLLAVPQIEWAARLGVTPVWARSLARNPQHARRVTLAILEAATERLRLEEAIVGGSGR